MNPETIQAGFAALRNYTLPSHPASQNWILTARIITPTTTVEIPTTDILRSGETDIALLITVATLATLPAGPITLQIIATSTGDPQIAHQEHLTLLAADATELRSQNRRTLDALNATLEGKATRDQSSISYNGRAISRLSWDELLKARRALVALVADETRRAAGTAKIQSVQLRCKN